MIDRIRELGLRFDTEPPPTYHPVTWLMPRRQSPIARRLVATTDRLYQATAEAHPDATIIVRHSPYGRGYEAVVLEGDRYWTALGRSPEHAADKLLALIAGGLIYSGPIPAPWHDDVLR